MKWFVTTFTICCCVLSNLEGTLAITDDANTTVTTEWSSYYKLHQTPATWDHAKQICAEEGADMFTPRTTQQVHLLQALMTTSKLYCGLYIGVSGTPHAKCDYINIEGPSIAEIPVPWATNEPDHPGQSCVVLLYDGTLADVACTDKMPFVCRKLSDNGTAQCPPPEQEIMVPDTSACENAGYTYYENTSSCYKFHDKPETWAEAVHACSKESGRLVVINSQQESDILKDIFAQHPPDSIHGATHTTVVHVGFQYDHSNEWRYLNGQTIAESGFPVWADGQPDNGGGTGSEQCGSIFRNGQLNNVGCDTKCAFICEIEPALVAYSPRMNMLLLK